VRRGLAAGLVAGVLAGLVGLLAGEPALDRAVELESAAAGASAEVAGPAVSRGGQRAGLVVGTALAGLAIGALFGVAAAWAVGRIAGGAWTRSLKLGAVLVATVVVLPAVKYPANPPGAGDPATLSARTTLYLGLVTLGLVLAATGWAVGRLPALAPLRVPVRQVLVGAGVGLVAVLVVVALPDLDAGPGVPAELLWSFRLGSLATQAVLLGGTAIGFGLLADRAER